MQTWERSINVNTGFLRGNYPPEVKGVYLVVKAMSKVKGRVINERSIYLDEERQIPYVHIGKARRQKVIAKLQELKLLVRTHKTIKKRGIRQRLYLVNEMEEMNLHPGCESIRIPYDSIKDDMMSIEERLLIAIILTHRSDVIGNNSVVTLEQLAKEMQVTIPTVNTYKKLIEKKDYLYTGKSGKNNYYFCSGRKLPRVQERIAELQKSIKIKNKNQHGKRKHFTGGGAYITGHQAKIGIG